MALGTSEGFDYSEVLQEYFLLQLALRYRYVVGDLAGEAEREILVPDASNSFIFTASGTNRGVRCRTAKAGRHVRANLMNGLSTKGVFPSVGDRKSVV